jgi:DNA repair protein NreA
MKKGGYAQRELIKFNFEALDLDSNEFFGNSPPSVFVGRFGYPQVNVGVLSPVGSRKDAYLMDSPKDWVNLNLKDEDILRLRAQLVNSRFKMRVKSFDHKLSDLSQEVGMAYKPVELEVELKSKPISQLKMTNVTKPMSNNANVRDIRLTENPKVKNVVEKTVSDIDLKSVEGLKKLYDKGVNENFLSKVLSIGLLGLKKNRKLVPTRWSITATDDTLAKEMLKTVKFNDCLDHTRVYFGGHLGNNYLVMFFPGVWSYELFEMQVPFKVNPWSKSSNYFAYDYETYDGRKKYALETAGGYYACKLGVVEKLNSLKKQGSVLVLRFITEEDRFPLGVWVCREATRISLSKNFIEFEDKGLALDYVKSLAKKKFGVDISELIGLSKVLGVVNTQKRISEFI